VKAISNRGLPEMHLKPRKPSTDPRLRSLLQKAARRGAVSIVERVANSLHSSGDRTWLRSRTVVIAFEECWPLAALLSIDRSVESKISTLRKISASPKQKDAAGLGALAYAYNQGDTSTLSFAPDQRILRLVAEAISRPGDFLQWVIQKNPSVEASPVVHAARSYLAVATWQWDKACILAGALLAIDAPFPAPAANCVEIREDAFPYWLALDKHTDEGKAALRDVAAETNVNHRQLLWASFYFGSAVVNELLPSPWFEAERAWRLNRAGIDCTAARELWAHATPRIMERLSPAALSLRAQVSAMGAEASVGQQSDLL
jgi:hypothetical protein